MLIGLVGCAPTTGDVIAASGSTVGVGSKAPDIEYVSMNGRRASFNRVRLPVTLVAFTPTEANSCSWLDPNVVNLSNEFWDLPVTVAQFSLPTDTCPHGQACVEVSNLHKGGLMSLCDAQRLAWKAYGQPAPGSLILIGANGKIVMMGSLSNPQPIIKEAKRLGGVEKQRLINQEQDTNADID
jgi:hypothetical protein